MFLSLMLAIPIILSLIVVTPAFAASYLDVAIYPSDDVFIRKGQPVTVQASSAALALDNSSGDERIGFVKYDISNYAVELSLASSIKLTIVNGNGGSTQGFKIYTLPNALKVWNSSSLSYNGALLIKDGSQSLVNYAPVDKVIGTFPNLAAGTKYTTNDLKEYALAQTDKILSFKIASYLLTGGYTINSRINANPETLTFTIPQQYVSIYKDYQWLTFDKLTTQPISQITSNLSLPKTGLLGSVITWNSSRPDVVNPKTGFVLSQANDTVVKMTASIKVPGLPDLTKEFSITVLRDTLSDIDAVNKAISGIDFVNKYSILSDFYLPETGGFRTTTLWTVEQNPALKIVNNSAIITRQLTNTDITLHVEVSRGIEKIGKDIVVRVVKKDAEKVLCNMYEEFDQYTDNTNVLNGWNINNGDGSVAKVTIDGVAAMAVSKSTGANVTSASFNFAQIEGETTFDIRMKATSKNTDILSLSGQNGRLIKLWCDSDNKLQADINGSIKEVCDFPLNEWFTLKLEINPTTFLMDLYVNGVKKIEEFGTGDKSINLNSVSVEISELSIGQIFIDYIKGYSNLYKNIDLTISTFNFNDIDKANITNSFNLPIIGVNDTKVNWISNNTSVISVNDGVANVTRPASSASDAIVELKAWVSNSVVIKEFILNLKVLRNKTDAEKVRDDLSPITIANVIDAYQTPKLNLPIIGENGSTIVWQSSNTKVIGTDGRVSSFGWNENATEDVKLIATAQNNQVVQTKEFNISVQRMNFASDKYNRMTLSSSNEPGHSPMFAVDGDNTTFWLSTKGDTKPSLKITLSDEIPFNQIRIKGYEKSTIAAEVEYSSNNIEWNQLCNITNIDEDVKIIKLDEVKKAKYIRYTVTDKTLDSAGLYEFQLYYKQTLSELLKQAVDNVTISDVSNIKTDFILPLNGLNNATFVWTSSNDSVIKVENDKAKVIRPENDTAVILGLRALLADEILTKDISLTVVGTNQTPPVSGKGGSFVGKNISNSGVSINLPEPTVQKVKPKNLYNDVNEDYWAKEYIENLSNKNIISGKGNDLFEPDANITREEFIKILIKGFGFEITSNNVEFTDVNKDSWSYPYIATAKELGIVNGISEKEFGSSLKITREDMAMMVVRASKSKGIKLSSPLNAISFNDEDDISDYAKESINILVNAQILSGFGENIFSPKQSATRAQAAKIIFMLIK